MFSALCHLGVLASDTDIHAPQPDADSHQDSKPVATMTYVVTLAAPGSTASQATSPEQAPTIKNSFVKPATPPPSPQTRDPRPVTTPPPLNRSIPAPKPVPPADSRSETVEQLVKEETPTSKQPDLAALPTPSALKSEQPSEPRQPRPADAASNLPVPATSRPPNADDFENYLAEIRGRIEANKFYPAAARRRGIEGSVKIFFVLDQTGAINNVSVGNAHRMLTAAIRQALEQAAPFDPPPWSGNKTINLSFTIEFKLK